MNKILSCLFETFLSSTLNIVIRVIMKQQIRLVYTLRINRELLYLL